MYNVMSNNVFLASDTYYLFNSTVTCATLGIVLKVIIVNNFN